jgi:hypothetical protein
MAIQAHLFGQGEFLIFGESETPVEVGEEGIKENPNQGQFDIED